MSYNDFVKYATRLLELGVKGVILTGGGEPTINPDFDKITNWLESNDIRYGINTNFNVFRDPSPVYLKVSLDGYDEESYKRRRGVHAYSRVIENIKKYRSDGRHKNTSLGVQIVVNELAEIEMFYDGVKYCRRLGRMGFEKASIRPAFVICYTVAPTRTTMFKQPFQS